jgi:hypothetical protein
VAALMHPANLTAWCNVMQRDRAVARQEMMERLFEAKVDQL